MWQGVHWPFCELLVPTADRQVWAEEWTRAQGAGESACSLLRPHPEGPSTLHGQALAPTAMRREGSAPSCTAASRPSPGAAGSSVPGPGFPEGSGPRAAYLRGPSHQDQKQTAGQAAQASGGWRALPHQLGSAQRVAVEGSPGVSELVWAVWGAQQLAQALPAAWPPPP